MSIFQRAASIAVATLFSVGLLNVSTPSFALEFDRGQITNPIPVPAVLNAPDVILVPADTSTLPDRRDEVSAPPVDETPNYATLSAAVASHDMPAEMSDELECLAGTIYYESKGEPLAGQLAVANVVINRTKSGRYPHTICEAVTQRGQFSFVRGGHVPTISSSNAAYRTAIAVAQVAINAEWQSPAPQAMFFHARRVAPGWSRTQVASIGNHVFYR
jgi:spore germination cell wall hydrolase CwlJ-like protein